MNSSFDRLQAEARERAAAAAQDWEATRVQTQLATRLYVGPSSDDAEARDIGRAVADDTRELFVACEPAEAITQQLDHLRPAYVAVHDLGSSVSRKLLAGLAAASQGMVRKLHVRRSGSGTLLASIEYIDCPAGSGPPVRLYSTDVEADTVARQSLARVLLGRSRLGIVMVGNLPAHALASAVAPWLDAARKSSWQCRRLLFMPLAASAPLPAEAARLQSATGIEASVTPPVARPADVWGPLCAAWNALQRQGRAGLDDLPLLGTPPPAAPAAAPAPMRPMPALAAHAAPRRSPLEHYLHDLAQLPGVVSACAFDLTAGTPHGHAGSRPGPDLLAHHGQTLLSALTGASRAMGLGTALPEVTVTLGQHHLLLRPLPGHPRLALHLVLDKPHVTLSLVQAQLHRLDEALLAATRPPPPG